MTAQLGVWNLFFYVTPGSAQATYVAANGNLVSSASGNPTLITNGAAITGSANGIALPVTCRVMITLSISAATTFSIHDGTTAFLMRINGVAGANTVVNGVHTFEDLWSPAMFTGTGRGFRFGANCTVNFFQAAYQVI